MFASLIIDDIVLGIIGMYIFIMMYGKYSSLLILAEVCFLILGGTRVEEVSMMVEGDFISSIGFVFDMVIWAYFSNWACR